MVTLSIFRMAFFWTFVALILGWIVPEVEAPTKPHPDHSFIQRANACSMRPLVVPVGAPPLIEYDPKFMTAASAELEAIKKQAPHVAQLVADYRTTRREIRAAHEVSQDGR